MCYWAHGLVHNNLQRHSTRPTSSISIEFEIRSNFAVFWFKINMLHRSRWNFTNITSHPVHNMFGWLQRKFTHITTVTLSWGAQPFLVISRICYQQEHYKPSLNFEFDENIVNGMGATIALEDQAPPWANGSANPTMKLGHGHCGVYLFNHVLTSTTLMSGNG